MAYEGIFAPITKISLHPNSDNGLKIVKIAGSQVITTVDYQVGDLACFFPEGGMLSPEFLFENSEYRFSSTLGTTVKSNKNPEKSGLFEASGRVRSIKLRGEISEGYIAPLSSFVFTGFSFDTVQAGYLFTELNGYPICDRYVSTKQREKTEKNKEKTRTKKNIWAPTFYEHFDTANFKYNYHRIPQDAHILITVKMHGTSGRTGNVLVTREKNLNWFQRLNFKVIKFYNDLIGLKNPFKEIFNKENITETSYETITGSRRVAFLNVIEDGYHKGTGFREKIHESLKNRLHKGETLYYEIVGYQSPNSPLFHHNVKKDNIGKDIEKQYKKYLIGNIMEYSYNCNRELGEHQIWIYRITQTNEDGHQIDLNYSQRIARCQLLGLNHVPRLFWGNIDQFTLGGKRDLLESMNELAEAPCSIFPKHISEGVVVEIEHPDMMKSFKNKSFSFRYLEGLIKDDDTYIDIEEIS
jgi:hypothetical protein